ncbi:MAG: hypothetical protein A2017_02860 [Lentisphaerae bacterium GWF2_44_16]|nr:MAG: hypothetical protein A2017_02860 [Lentisphaerae bacterium GWF2_44_16]
MKAINIKIRGQGGNSIFGQKNELYECFKLLQKVIFFTLVELLIVISIIAILASLLLPALRNSRNIAKETICKGNLRQLGLCTSNYADDYLNYAPYWYYGHNFMFSDSYENPFYDYISSGPHKENGLPYLAICPSGKRYDDDEGASVNSVRNFSYGYNAAISAYGFSIPPIKLDRIRNPAGKLLMTDTTWGGSGIYSRERFYFRHRNAANILFADNHIELWKWEKVPIDSNETGGFYYDK